MQPYSVRIEPGVLAEVTFGELMLGQRRETSLPTAYEKATADPL